MSDDPLAEIISMSNDDKISKNEDDDDVSDDTTDDEISDDENVVDVKTSKSSEKGGEAKGKKFTESKKKKKKKINKKLLNRDLKNNKLRQIRISLPYDPNKNGEDKTDSPGSVIDYNESKEVETKEVDNVKKVKVPIHKRRWFKVLIIILITIACSILVSITSIKVYRYAKGRIDEMKMNESNGKTNEINNFGINGGNGRNKSNAIGSGLWSNETKEDEVKEEPNYDKMINQIGSIKGGKKYVETKNSSINSNSGVPRDSKGRFVKRK